MNAQRLLALSCAALLAFIGFTSCNKENKTGDQAVGKFEIQDKTSPISSIELTSDGEYIITKNVTPTKSDDLDLNDVWVYGDFTFVDGCYYLKGFGQIIINWLSDAKAEISIESGGWDPFTVQATLASTVKDTKMNHLLCRHWVFDKTHFSLAYNDFSFINFEAKGCDFSTWYEKTGDEEENENVEEECTGLIFTQSGTYAVVYDGGKINVGSWSWENAEDGSLACDWSTKYSSFFKDYRFQGSLVVDVEEGDPSTCTIVRSFESSMEKFHLFSAPEVHKLTTTLTYYLHEE